MIGGEQSQQTDSFKQVGTQWNQNHPTPRIGIGDISRQAGGSFSPHTEHQNGLDFDVRYVGKNGYQGPLDLAITNDLVNIYDRA